MFINLFNLIHKASEKTPLEDFTTEGFAGLLKNQSILKSFITWLKLPPGNYTVSTQNKYCLEGDENCKIDLVLESPEVLCFIENKVNSPEGWRQLERYLKVLDLEEGQRRTYLKYCTRKVDIKNYTTHNFHQFRWYDIANWLQEKHLAEPLVQDYLNFLKKHRMAKDTSIYTETAITLGNFTKTLEKVNFHIENAWPSFKKLFPKAVEPKKYRLKDIEEHERIARAIGPVLKEATQWNEILYGVQFEKVKLQSQIWINASHPMAQQVLGKAKEFGGFQYWEDEYGIGIFQDCKLYQFIESKNSDQEILEWFKRSFEHLRAFIDSTPELNWDEKVQKKVQPSSLL